MSVMNVGVSSAPRREVWEYGDFGAVVGPLMVRLHRLARRILHSDDLAEDAVQEAVLCSVEGGPAATQPRSLAQSARWSIAASI